MCKDGSAAHQERLVLIIGAIIVIRHLRRILIDDPPSNKVIRFELKGKEFAFFERLALQPDTAMTKKELAFCLHVSEDSKVLHTWACRIRKKLGDAKSALVTVRGGFMLSSLRS